MGQTAGVEAACEGLLTWPALRCSHENPCLLGWSNWWPTGPRLTVELAFALLRKGWLTTTLSSSISSFVKGRWDLISPCLTFVHPHHNEDGDQWFIIIKSKVAELHLLTIATVSAARRWHWHYFLNYCWYISLYHHSYWKNTWKCVFVNELFSTNWSPEGSWGVRNYSWKLYVNGFC